MRNDGSTDELEIKWIMDISKIDYVREGVVYCSRRKAKPKCSHPALVGYAILKPEAKGISPGIFKRRYFWLAEHDRYYYPEGVYKTGAPSEAVDPRTVVPGRAGEVTERVIGKTFDKEVA